MLSDAKIYGSLQDGSVSSSDSDTGAVGAHDLRLKCCACVLCLGVMGEGYDWSVMNGVSVKIQQEFKCSTFNIAALVSMAPLGIMFGTIIGGQLADSIGRRRALTSCCSILMIGSMAMALANSIVTLILSRCFVGVGMGMGYVLVSTCITEVSPSSSRGTLTAMQEVALNLGMVLGYSSNLVFVDVTGNWRWMLALGAVLPMLLGIFTMLPLFPESPRWLVMQGRCVEAEAVLARFMSSQEAKQTYHDMREAKNTSPSSWADLFHLTNDLPKRRALLAAVTVAVAQTASGFLSMTNFSTRIFKLSMSEDVALRATITMGVTKALVVLLVLVVLERVGRRSMLLASLSVTSVSSALIAITSQFSLGWFAEVASVSLFMAGFSLGLGPICFLYIAEALDSGIRAKGMALCLLCSRMVGFCSLISFPSLIDGLGMTVVFWCQSATNCAMLFVVWHFTRETGGYSLEAMRDVWQDR